MRLQSTNAETRLDNPKWIFVLLTISYMFYIYIISAVMSSTAQLLGTKTGYKNEGPRSTLAP